jgi:imidazolonepropionase-like amidohydrolase
MCTTRGVGYSPRHAPPRGGVAGVGKPCDGPPRPASAQVRAVRAASPEDLLGGLLKRLDAMLRGGTTSVEIKSGYGLDAATEVRHTAVTHTHTHAHTRTHTQNTHTRMHACMHARRH